MILQRTTVHHDTAVRAVHLTQTCYGTNASAISGKLRNGLLQRATVHFTKGTPVTPIGAHHVYVLRNKHVRINRRASN